MRLLHRLRGALLVAISVVLGGMLTSHGAAAIGNVYFDSGDTNRSGESYVLSVGETQYVRQAAANLKVYFPNKNGKVTFSGYNYCPGGSDAGTDDVSGNITTYDISSPGGKIDGKSSPTFFYGTYKKASSNDCNASKAASKKTISVTDAAYDNDLKLYYVRIAVTHVQKKSGYDNIQNTFKVSTPTTGGTISHEGGKGKGYEVTMEHAGSSGHTNYKIKFGTDCTVKKKNVQQSIALYDLDNDGGSGAQLGGKVTLSLTVGGTTRKVKVSTSRANVNMTDAKNSVQPNGDNKTVYLHFNTNPGERYILHMDKVWHNNTIQFQTPFDGKYYDAPCNPTTTTGTKVWNATPTTAMSLQPNSTGASVAKKGTSANPTWVKPGDTVRWEHTVTNNLTSERKTTEKIIATIKRYKEPNLPDRSWAKDRAVGASKTYKAGDGGDKSSWMKKVITDEDMGKTFCQRVGINPSGINKNGKLKGEVNSAYRCVLVTATGGDIEASVTASPRTYSYYPSLNAKATVSSTGFPVIDKFKKVNYPRSYDWKIFEVKFTKQPLGSIAESAVADCKSVTDKAPYKSIMLSDSCVVAKQGKDLFGSAIDKPPATGVSNKQQGPDPIGTWTCYTLQYRINPKPSTNLRGDTGDIRKFVDDWNDGNKTSKEPTRWNDKRWKNSSGAWKGDPAKKYADEYKDFKEKVPIDVARYQFTPFDEDSCSVSGIDPKVQIRGNDLKVGNTISTSVRRNSQGAFGSSSEYSVLSGGLNSGMASGSGLLAGAAQASLQASWSPLTFTNNTASFGNFDGVPVDSDEPEPTDVIEGDATWNELSPLATAQGARKVYKINGRLVVSGNLEYASAYPAISKIPRVIIIARDIQIDSNVTRIDPWLIAENISTCGAPRGAAWGDSAAEALSGANLKIGDCNKPLTFNGAVSVDNLYLYRTGGSRVLRTDLPGTKWSPDTVSPDTYCEGTCGGAASVNADVRRRYALSAPAEVFNLRPDIYLSSFSGMKTRHPVATTDRITELPPRF